GLDGRLRGIGADENLEDLILFPIQSDSNIAVVITARQVIHSTGADDISVSRSANIRIGPTLQCERRPESSGSRRQWNQHVTGSVARKTHSLISVVDQRA